MSFQQKIDFSPLRGQFFVENKVRFGFLVEKYVGMGQTKIWKNWFDFVKKPKNRFFSFFGFFTKIKINHYKNQLSQILVWPIPTYFLTRNPNLTLFSTKNWLLSDEKLIFCWKLNFQIWLSIKKTRFWPLWRPFF